MQFDILMLTISFTHHQSNTSNAFKKENYLFDCLTWSYTSNHVLKWYMKLIQTFFSPGTAWSSKTYTVFSRSTDHKCLKWEFVSTAVFMCRSCLPAFATFVYNAIYIRWFVNIVWAACLSLRRIITKRKHILSPYTKMYF